MDFLLRKGDRFTAVEVKSSRRLSGDDFRGLRGIAELKGLDRRILVAPVPDPLRTEDGIEGPLRASGTGTRMAVERRGSSLSVRSGLLRRRIPAQARGR